MNHIIVLKDGAISEEGNPKELAKQDGIYAELLRLQSTIQPSSEEEETRLKEYDLAV